MPQLRNLRFRAIAALHKAGLLTEPPAAPSGLPLGDVNTDLPVSPPTDEIRPSIHFRIFLDSQGSALRVFLDAQERAIQDTREAILREIRPLGEFKVTTDEPYWKIPVLHEISLTLYPTSNAEWVFEHVLRVMGSGWTINDTGFERDAVASALHGGVHFRCRTSIGRMWR